MRIHRNIMSTFLICIFVAVFLYLGVPCLYIKYSKWQLKRKSINDNALVLTFDDGPGERLTSVILNLLAKYNVKASFFILGREIIGREAIVRQIVEQGHEICSHGYDHLNFWKVLPVRTVRDIKRGWQAIDTALGTDRGKYAFRPPYGKLNLVSFLYLLFRKVPIVLWTLNSGDRVVLKTNPMVLRYPDTQRIAVEVKKPKGAVVLFHDSDRRNSDIESFTLESIRSMLATADEIGMRVITISQLLNYD